MALLLISSTRVRNLRKYNLNDCSVVTTMSDTGDDKKSLTARNKSLHTHVEIAPKSAAVFRPQCLQSPCNSQKNKMRIFQGSSFHRTLGNQGIVTLETKKKDVSLQKMR